MLRNNIIVSVVVYKNKIIISYHILICAEIALRLEHKMCDKLQIFSVQVDYLLENVLLLCFDNIMLTISNN